MSNDTYDTYEAVELAKISLDAARDAYEQAQYALAQTQREHEIAEAVLAAFPDDEEAVEELADEGFEYSDAEAIVRGARHDHLTAYDVRNMTREELRAVKADGRASQRVMRLVEAGLSRAETADRGRPGWY